MISRWFTFSLASFALAARAAVEVSVESGEGLAWLRYNCTDGEVVRAFALDVTVDRGQILDVSNFFVGESTSSARGYGIFPSSFRDHAVVGPESSINWASETYTPVAPMNPGGQGTLPGLGSSGVTLEFGGIWDPGDPTAVPASSGILCSLQISEGATVSVTSNQARGGVVVVDPDVFVTPSFTSEYVQPPEITGWFEVQGIILITFEGGELEIADSLEGPWTATGNTNGLHAEYVTDSPRTFFRVSHP